MQDSSHYRKEAQKFVEQANSAKNSEHRLLLLQKAQTMIRMAELAEAMERVVQDQGATADTLPATSGATEDPPPSTP